MQKKKVLITGGNGMLAYDCIRTQSDVFDIIKADRRMCDVTSFESVMQCIAIHEPDILLNCSAYTAVDDAEDIGMKECFDVNTLGVKNLAKATAVFGIGFITISTDYVFDGNNRAGYLPTDLQNPKNIYGMSKYLGEQLAIDENPNTVIVRTSWLYGGEIYDSKNPGKPGVFKNFVNTMLRFSDTREELRVVDDQYGIPTSCTDLSRALMKLMETLEERLENQETLYHFASSGTEVTWADFAEEIFSLTNRSTQVVRVDSDEYPTKALRPKSSILKNPSDIVLPDWKAGLKTYLNP